MQGEGRLFFLDNLRTFLIFLVVLIHSGVVYESSGLMGPYWIVDDPSTSDLPGLMNLFLDIFVMATIFFISGFLTPSSVERKGSLPFLKSKLRRLVVPWVLALFTLIPLYNALFLYSRELPQGPWTTYFHFSNGHISMSWLWFLPVLFLFDVSYVLLHRLNLTIDRMSLAQAVAAVFVVGLGTSLALGALGWIGWTKTPLIDFQNERLLPYFAVFLLGSACYRRRVFDADRGISRLFIAVGATAWIPICLYVITVLNYILRPGRPLISAAADPLLLWSSLYLSLLALLYSAVATFRQFFHKQGRLGRVLSRSSYGVYILHIAVMGPIAVALLGIDVPAIVKYPILAVTTYVASNLIVYGYHRTVGSLIQRFQPAH